ncbi:MAG TPA: ORF6N domain-containing protein [Chthoniobacterales bacterium]|nr:ORF6N domain-containing protein [Chthoniobacterales bacterium]
MKKRSSVSIGSQPSAKLAPSAPSANGSSHEFRLAVRGQRVILDSDLARIYGVETKALNRAVKRNADRFPRDFVFQLTREESGPLRYQTGTLNTGRGVHRKYRPYAFTEHGALQAANVLRSKRAVQMSVFVIRAFVKMREALSTNETVMKRLSQIDNTLFLHDAALRELFQKLRPLLQPPPEPPKKQIGFHSGK